MPVSEDIDFKLQQRIFIKTCVNLNKSPNQTSKALSSAFLNDITNLYKKKKFLQIAQKVHKWARKHR
jgi:hypothetical protein